jgi:hypothetical protein
MINRLALTRGKKRREGKGRGRGFGCVWQGFGCGCGSSGCGCAGGADSVEELKPFYENVWQNSFSWLRNVDKKVKCP